MKNSKEKQMIAVFDEQVFFEQTHIEDSFRTNLVAFIIIFRGSITLELNNTEYVSRKGNVIPISPKHLYKLKRFSEDLKLYIIAVDKKKISEKITFNFNKYDAHRLSGTRENGNSLAFSDNEIANLTHLAELLDFYSVQENETSFKEEISLSLFSSFIYIVSGKLLDSTESNKNLNTRKEAITMEFLDLLRIYYRQEKELQFYADKLFISVKHLSNCVREITNAPPTKFIADAIINEAKISLLNSKKTVRMIASELGFSDQYAFGKFFKRHTNYSPKNFRIHNKLVKTF